MKKQRLISRLVAGSMVLLLPVLSLCGCTQQQAPDQAQVSALIEQAEEFPAKSSGADISRKPAALQQSG